jgi:hypothetical protein
VPSQDETNSHRERAALHQAAGPGPDCLPVEELALLAEAPSSQPLPTHVAACPYCRTEVSWMRAALTAEPAAAEAADVAWITSNLSPVQPPPTSWWTNLLGSFRQRPLAALSWAGAAACLLLAVALNVRPPNDLALPDASGSGTLRSARLEPLAPRGDLSAPPTELRWQAFPGAQRYDVELTEVDSTVLWHTESSALELALPPAVARLAVPGKTLQWTLRARAANGQLLAQSDPISFRVAIPDQK